MLNEKMRKRAVERLVDRIEDLNRDLLVKIGEQIKYIGTLTPSQAHQLSKIILYGEDINTITRQIARITKLNYNDIYAIFKEEAKQNQEFAKQFYKARKIDFIPYEKNKTLQRQVEAIAKITADTYRNIMNSTGMVLDNKFIPLGKIYQEVMDKAIISVIQGKETYDQVMRKTMKQLTNKGIRVRYDKNGNPTGTKVLDYKSGYSRRLDSAVRMNVLDGVRGLSNELQKQFGKEFGADGVEISAHENPAPDHADIQGKQYSNEEFEDLNKRLDRPISTMNCYHYIFSIVLGVSKPEYSQEELDKMNKKNEKGFVFEGKHYTNYQGTQMQRQIETKIRQLKDRQIIMKASGDMEEVGNCQRKITQLTHKYNGLCDVSGLVPQRKRMAVSGYRRVNISKIV